MATVRDTARRAEGRRQGDVVGSDHPDRRHPRHPHRDRLRRNQQVLKCYSTSMIFRGFDIFMKGIDPRDAHFITSRICGICGDNHCTCSCLNQNMAYGVKPPPLGDFAFNLAETADYMFDHAIFNDCMANVDFCEQMVKETNPIAARRRPSRTLGAALATSTATGRSPTSCGRSTRSPASSTWRRCRWRATRARCTACSAAATRTRRRSCPAACSAHITHQTLHRLLRAADALHRLRQAHACRCTTTSTTSSCRSCRATTWSATATRTSSAGAAFDDPDYVDYDYRNMTEWGRKRYITPGVVDQRRADHDRPGRDQPDDPDPARQLVLRRLDRTRRPFVTQDPLGNPVDKRHPWNKVTLPEAAEARLRGQVQLGRLAADVRQAHRHATSAATPAAARSRASG